MPITDPVGPVVQAGDLAKAVAAAAVVDNPGREVEVRDRGAYVRIEVGGGECVLRRPTIEAELGRPFRMRDLEVSMPSFVGRIDTGTDQIRFYLHTTPAEVTS
ncbi:MmoB/DmpM family protein [Trujillonella humicola]|uniref:MmoB/DmpM family protein n=1 Tax=Trujillonella humicola TaxID=3383699 RepID=UPI0039063221